MAPMTTPEPAHAASRLQNNETLSILRKGRFTRGFKGLLLHVPTVVEPPTLSNQNFCRISSFITHFAP